MEKVWADVRQGYVSHERAKADYRVVVDMRNGEPVLNESATQLFRGEKEKNAGNKNPPLL